jgi:short-subunit dehydrogenase
MTRGMTPDSPNLYDCSVHSKIVAITGASAGIGRACAERLARGGAAVVLSARRAALLDDLARAITDHGGRALAVPGDVTIPGDMRALVAAAVERFGRLDVMICNTGIGYHGALVDTPPEVADRLVRVNLLGTIYAARAACEVFVRQRAGHVIAVSSVVGLRGTPGASVYSATKAAQKAFIESLRSEFLGTGIHASVVFPVSTRTEFRAAMARDFGHAVEGIGPRQDADDVAAAIERCVRSPRAEVYPYRPAWWLGWLNSMAPAAIDRLVKKYERRRQP